MTKNFAFSAALILSLAGCGGTPSLVGTWTKTNSAGTTGTTTLTFAGTETSGTLTITGAVTTTATACQFSAMGTGTWAWPSGGSLAVTLTSASGAQTGCTDTAQNYAQMTFTQAQIDALNASISGTVVLTATTLTITGSGSTETYTR